MTTILNIAKRYAFREPALTAALAFPRYPRALSFAFGVLPWRRITIAAVATVVLAAAAYVVAVNAILLAGEDLKREQTVLAALQQEQGLLASTLVARESPAWLEASAKAHGMVEATGVRFLSSGGTVALSR